jgi:hypothetical protein
MSRWRRVCQFSELASCISENPAVAWTKASDGFQLESTESDSNPEEIFYLCSLGTGKNKFAAARGRTGAKARTQLPAKDLFRQRTVFSRPTTVIFRARNPGVGRMLGGEGLLQRT